MIRMHVITIKVHFNHELKMDNRLGEMLVFLEVARTGTFAAAAKSLRLTPSAVSRAMSRLETRLGVQLVSRTTRSLALTPEGESYRARVSGLVEELDDVERSFGKEAQTARGPLRINASVPFGVHVLLPLLPRFMECHPGITPYVDLTDSVVDLVDQRADVAFRVGPLRDSSLLARKIGRSGMAVVGSPDYLARYGHPSRPEDLERHLCLRFSFRRTVDAWPFLIDGVGVQKAVEGAFFGNSGEVVRLMAIAGGGVARLGRFHVADDLASGRLVEILEAFNPGDQEDIHAVYVKHERLASRIHAFLDFFSESFKGDDFVGGARRSSNGQKGLIRR